MASEYLRWKYRDVQPDPPKQYTRRQRVENWFYYHKWHLVIGAVLLFMAVDIGKDMLGIGRVKPDYQVAYVGTVALPADTAAALQDALAALGADQNGDGQVTVALHQYVFTGNAEANSAAYGNAVAVTLMGDLESGDSFLFLLEDYETFQAGYQALAAADGTLAEGRTPPEHYRWADCPALAGLPLGEYEEVILGQVVSGESQALLQDLTVARRGTLDGGRGPRYPEACNTLWNTIKEGASA